jgi:hypothetical protein
MMEKNFPKIIHQVYIFDTKKVPDNIKKRRRMTKITVKTTPANTIPVKYVSPSPYFSCSFYLILLILYYNY